VESALIPSLKGVLNWAEEEKFLGHDPHDLLEAPLFRSSQAFLPATVRLAILQIGRRSHFNLHRFFGVPKSQNPKSLALFLSGLTLAKEYSTEHWLMLAKGLAERLTTTQTSGWGYPFPWQSRSHYLPKGAPTIVVTAFVANALLDLFQIDKDERWLNSAIEAASFIAHEIPITKANGGIAFGYAPNDTQVVFNASLLGAELLARVGRITIDDQLLELAMQAGKFVITYQNDDGSWIYGLEKNQTWIDSFHTGFVLCSLRTIGAINAETKFLESANKGFEFFKSHFIASDGSPAYFHDRLYPIDAHSAAQTIITLAQFGERDEAQRVALKTIALLQSPEGYFYYQATKNGLNKIPYMRWSNAWMFRALAELTMSETTT
jgi:uncharacterized protein YyaL (SSP411 family)